MYVVNVPANTSDNVDHASLERALEYSSVVLSVIALYLALSQIGYFLLAHVVRKERSRDHDHARSLNILCACAGIMTCLRVGLPMERMIGFDTDAKCIAVMEYQIITFGLSFSVLYTILWIRQRAFYWCPALHDLSTKTVKIFSLATPFIIWPGCIVSIVIVNFAERFYATEYGCAIERLSINTFAWTFRGAAFFLMQCNLLALFIYPLYRHRVMMRRSAIKETDSIDNLIARSILTTVVCIIVDNISMLIGLLVQRELAILPLFVYDVNLVVDTFAVIWSFSNFAERLFPWIQLKRCRKVSDTASIRSVAETIT